MKYSKLVIVGIPKSFHIWNVLDYIQPSGEDERPEDVSYDFYPAECDEESGEDACVLFKYNESSTGVFVLYTPHLQTLDIELSPWAVETDVLLFASIVNAILAKHKRAKLYDKYAPLKGLSDDDVHRMIKERKAYLKRKLKTKEGFTMEGINTDFTLQVAHLRPAISPDMQVLELQRNFVKMQWDAEDEEDISYGDME